MRLFYLVSVLFLFSYSVFATTFYIDPFIGNNDNDGSLNAPWHTLEEVINSGKINYYENAPLPYDAANNILTEKNVDGLVKGGDTLMLMNGLHGSIELSNYNNLDYITIIAGEGQLPVLKNLLVRSSSKWRFVGLNISSELYNTYISDIPLVKIEDHNWQGPAFDILISECNVYSTESPWDTADEWLLNASDGIFIRANNVTVSNNIVSNVDMGITCFGDHINASGNSVVNFSGDGMRILGSYDTLEYNIIKNCYDVDDNHDDGMQSYTTNGLVVDNNIFSSNFILNYEDPNQPLLGALQGIGCFDGPYNNWTVENNVIFVNHWHGITFLGAYETKIINNTVLDQTPDVEPGPVWIRIDDHKDGTLSENCTIKNNATNSVVGDADKSNNITMSSIAEYEANFVNPSTFDFHLLAESELVDAADPSSATTVDIEQTPRTYGSAPDVGAYELIQPDLVQNLDNPSVQCFPNPFRSVISLTGEWELYLVDIIDINGTIVQRNLPIMRNGLIKLGSLNNGSYQLIFKDDAEKVHFSRLIIKQ